MRDIHHSRGWGGGNGENGLKACFNQQQSRSHNWNGKRAYHQVKNNNKSELRGDHQLLKQNFAKLKVSKI